MSGRTFLPTLFTSARASLPNDMDRECVALCEAINACPGLKTIESCCGHGEQPFHVWLTADDQAALLPMLYAIDGCHSGVCGWTCAASTDCSMTGVVYCVEGHAGDFAGADVIAAVLRECISKEAS